MNIVKQKEKGIYEFRLKKHVYLIIDGNQHYTNPLDKKKNWEIYSCSYDEYCDKVYKDGDEISSLHYFEALETKREAIDFIIDSIAPYEG